MSTAPSLLLAGTALLFGMTLPACNSSAHSSASPRASVTGVVREGGAFPYEVKRTTLDNGLTVLCVPMKSEGLVSYWSIVRTGSRDEVEEGVTGFAHFFEHMMFRGSKNFPGDLYDDIVKSMGADANAYTTDDYTAYHLSFTREDLPRVIEIEADRFQFLEYDEPGFRTEAGAVYGEYRKGRTSPWQVLFEALHEKAFDVHTYKHTTIGFEADIARMPEQFEYSKSFFRRFYRPENVVLVVAGDFDPDQALGEIRKRYGGWRKGYETPRVEPEPEQRAQRRLTVPFEGRTLPVLTLSFKGERFRPDDRTLVAGLLLGELAFGETSPLYKKLVLSEQRLDALFEDFGENRDPGLWNVIARVKDPADVRAIEEELWAAIESLRSRPVSAARLAEVASRRRYGFLSRLSTPSQVCENLARTIALTGDISAVDTLFATLATVTPEDVQQAARRWLAPERATVAVLHTAGEPVPPGMEEPVTARAASAGSIARDALVTLPTDDPVVSFALWFKAGSQDDPPGKEGLAALTAELVSEGGTRALAYDQFLERLFPIAADFGVSVDKEMTVVRGRVHRDKLEQFYELFVEAVREPGFREQDFVRLRDRTLTYLEKSLRYSSDEELGKAALYGRVFEGTPYEHLVQGTVASLRALTLEDAKAFHRARWTRDNLVLGVGGAYPPDLPERLRVDLASLPAGRPAATPAPKPRPIEGRHALLVEKPGPSTAISLGYPIDLRRGTREFYALWVANSWLGEHRNSAGRLYQVIREARGMNYGDYSYIEAFPGGGGRRMPPTGVGRRRQLFELWIRPVPREQALFALRAALREVDELARKGLTREQFEATREFLKKYSLHFAETTAERLGYAVDDRFYGLDDHLTTFRRTLDELTLEEVNAAVRKHLSTKNLVIALVSEKTEELAAALVADAPSPMDYGELEKPAAVLAEDKEIERYPLALSAERVTIVPVDRMFQGGTLAEASSGKSAR